MRASKKHSKELPIAEQVLFSALRMFHDKTAVAKVAEELEASPATLLPSFLRQQLPLLLKIEWDNSLK
jgi:hypothetical protein